MFTDGVNKNNIWDETARVYIQVKIWLKRSLDQLDGGATMNPWLLFLAPTQGHFSLTALSHCRPLLGAIALHSLFLYSDTPCPCPSSFRSAQTSLNQNFTRINNLAVSSQLFFLFTWLVKKEQTGCSKMSAHKIQTLGNHPKRMNRTGIKYCSLCLYSSIISALYYTIIQACLAVQN